MLLVDLVTRLFYPEGFEATIRPTKGQEGVVFRGVMEKRWLRLPPDFLKALYGGYTEFEWTMVGQITYLPGGEPIEIPPLLAQTSNSGSPANAAGNSEPPEGVQDTAESRNSKGLSVGAPEQATEPMPLTQKVGELPSMRDPFRTVFAGLAHVERMFLESKQRVEVLIHPLAIYRETKLNPIPGES